jgi:hypothetical protein
VHFVVLCRHPSARLADVNGRKEWAACAAHSFLAGVTDFVWCLGACVAAATTSVTDIRLVPGEHVRGLFDTGSLVEQQAAGRGRLRDVVVVRDGVASNQRCCSVRHLDAVLGDPVDRALAGHRVVQNLYRSAVTADHDAVLRVVRDHAAAERARRGKPGWIRGLIDGGVEHANTMLRPVERSLSPMSFTVAVTLADAA